MSAVLDRAGLDELVDVLTADGYRVVGPTVRDEAIILAELESGSQLPDGWGVETAPGLYRIHRRSDAAVFSHSAGPQSWKQFLHPPRQMLWSSDGADAGYQPRPEEPVRYAFLGVRGCDLAAIATLGNVLGAGAHPDAAFNRRRRGVFVIAAGCTEPGGLCFCASMGTGPAPGPGYDLSLTERIDESGHRFVVDVATDEGARILAAVRNRAATPDEVHDARDAVAAAASHMGRQLPASEVRQLLIDSRESPAMGGRRQPLPDLRQLHDGLPDVFLHHDRGRHGPDRRARRTHRALGVLLRAGLLLSARRQRSHLG